MIKKISYLYFSPGGNVKRIAKRLCEALEKFQCSKAIGIEDIMVREIDVTMPMAREDEYHFEPDTLTIIGAPVYAGRIPNKIMPFFKEKVFGEGPCITFVSYGNRNFDNALAELSGIAINNGFSLIGVIAMPSEHSFSDKLATGRPDIEDFLDIDYFAEKISDKICDDLYSLKDKVLKIEDVPGDSNTDKYYTPLDENGNPAMFLKAKPVVDMDKCSLCGTCERKCPMGSVKVTDISDTPGLCIKCQACVKCCNYNARSFTDKAFISHVNMLINAYSYTRERKAPVFIV